MISKWTGVGILLVIFFTPMLFLPLITEKEVGWFWAFLLPVSVILFFAIREYKERQQYINERVVDTIKGDLRFDRDSTVFYLGNEKLKLHRKWYKHLRDFMGEETILKNVTLEAVLHTYNLMDNKPDRAYQPISLQSDSLTIHNSILESTRHYVFPLYLFITSALIVVLSVSYGNFLPTLYYSFRDLMQSNIPTLSASDDFHARNIKDRQVVTITGRLITQRSGEKLSTLVDIKSTETTTNTGIKVYGFEFDIPQTAHPGLLNKMLRTYTKPATLTGIIYLRSHYSMLDETYTGRHILFNERYTWRERMYLIGSTLLWLFFIVIMSRSFYLLVKRMKGYYFYK